MAVDTSQTKEGGDITFMDMVDEREALGESEIQKLFAGATVFLTGGTGFLGKLMLDKLLRSCPDIKKIYVLARPKKNKEILKRLQEQFDDVLYDKLRKENPGFIEKIGAIEGDIGLPGLGMKEEDRKRLIDEVEMIFHGAATVRFDEPLKSAVHINVRGTKEILQLAHACSKLKAVVHISTAYSNCPLKTIDEKFYDHALHGDKLIDLVETLDEKILNNITPGLLGDFPNTYTYTKAAAESIVKQYGQGLPLAMFRPAVVISTVKEPVAGWIDNVYGPTGVVVGAAVGLIHALHAKPSALADLVPGDYVVNAIIASAWKAATDSPRNLEAAPAEPAPPVYNYVAGEQNPLTWEQFMRYNEQYGMEVPTSQAVYYYILALIQSKHLYKLYCFFLHWIPAYLVDGIAMLIGKKPVLRKAYTKIEKFSEVISYFSTREWKFHNKNTQSLYNELNDADKHIFEFDMAKIEWGEYFATYVKGIRMYLLKDPSETIPQALVKHRRLKFLHYAACTILGGILLKILWSVFKIVFGF